MLLSRNVEWKCKGMFRSFWLGCNSIQIICCVYLYGIHLWPVVMCVFPIQNCCYKTKESKILLCCLTWHSHCFKNGPSEVWGMLQQWLIKYEIVVWTCSYMCTFVCRLWGPVHWDPLEALLKLRYIKLQMLKLWRCISANENIEGCWKNASS